MTPVNYTQLQQLYEKYRGAGFAVLAFPCNQFGGQEPGDEPNIKEIVRNDHKATFPLFKKVKVNGNDAHPLWKYLKHKQTGVLGSAIKWNFTKFLCDRNGVPVQRYAPTTKPLDMEKDIVKLLGLNKP